MGDAWRFGEPVRERGQSRGMCGVGFSWVTMGEWEGFICLAVGLGGLRRCVRFLGVPALVRVFEEGCRCVRDSGFGFDGLGD